jgi:hypothetical protein
MLNGSAALHDRTFDGSAKASKDRVSRGANQDGKPAINALGRENISSLVIQLRH